MRKKAAYLAVKEPDPPYANKIILRRPTATEGFQKSKIIQIDRQRPGQSPATGGEDRPGRSVLPTARIRCPVYGTIK